jgi:hypothetical protein
MASGLTSSTSQFFASNQAASLRPKTPRSQWRQGRAQLRVQAVAEFVRVNPKEAVLYQKLRVHDASLAATLVLKDDGERCSRPSETWQCVNAIATVGRLPVLPVVAVLQPLLPLLVRLESWLYPCLRFSAASGKKIITSSLDKTLALWSSQVRSCDRCFRMPPHAAALWPSSAALCLPPAVPFCWVLHHSHMLGAAGFLQGDCEQLEAGGLQEETRLAPPGGPIFSLALDSREQDGLPSQVRGLFNRLSFPGYDGVDFQVCWSQLWMPCPGALGSSV